MLVKGSGVTAGGVRVVVASTGLIGASSVGMAKRLERVTGRQTTPPTGSPFHITFVQSCWKSSDLNWGHEPNSHTKLQISVVISQSDAVEVASAAASSCHRE